MFEGEYISLLIYFLALAVVLILSMPLALLLLNILKGSSLIEGRIRKKLKKGRLSKLLLRIDHYLYRSSGTIGADKELISGWRSILFPFPLTITWLIILMSTSYLKMENIFNGFMDDEIPFLELFSIIFIIIGVLIHFYCPPLSRKFKYDVILSGLTMVPFGGFIILGSYFANIIPFGSFALKLISINLFFLIFIIKSPIIFKRVLPKERAKRMKWVRWNTVILVPILIIAIGDIGSVIIFTYLLMRYFLIEWLYHRPILYFRSFRSDHIQDYFSNVIAKVASRYGLVIGLVQSELIDEDYRSNNRVEERARLFMTSNDSWKQWVMKYLNKASAVIIHLDERTAGVVWEVNTSKKIVGPEKVIVLEPNFKADNVDELYYESQRNQLKEKMDKLFLDPS
jgi:hypothetical protein